MKNDLIDLLGRAYSEGKMDELAPFMAYDCDYSSDYANIAISGAETIIERMKKVDSNIDDTCKYSYKIINLSEHLTDGVSMESFDTIPGIHIVEKGLLLYQFSREKPVAVVMMMVDNETGLIKRIDLSRKKNLFNVNFYNEELEQEDSLDDLPSSVKPLTPREREIKELQNAFSGQHLSNESDERDDNLYIWREADKFAKEWLNENGYSVLESQIFDDCIGYRCNRKDYAYTVFMYAYGRRQTAQLDGDYCEKLLRYPFAEKSTVLVMYLNVKRYLNGEKIEYKVYNYTGNERSNIELWRVSYINKKPILQFYPRKEMMDLIYKLMFAFNHNNKDVYDNIIAYYNPSFIGPGDSGYAMNDAVVGSLCRIREKYGAMKLGYVRYNDVIYCSVPYVEGYGFFGFRVADNTDKIIEITAYPFDGGERKVAEFIRTEIREPDDLYDFIPKAVHVSALPPVKSERFALKIVFDNGETKKYVLPIEAESESDEVVKYHHHVFTDCIWNTAKIVMNDSERIVDQFALESGAAIQFKNNYHIPVMTCYLDGTNYSEPVMCNEIVYEDDNYKLCKKWQWRVNALYEDKETGLFKVLLSGQAFNRCSKSTFVTSDGKRITTLDFDHIDNFFEGFAKVGSKGRGYGFIDKEMNLVIPMQYEYADRFADGKAIVIRDGMWYYIDKAGKEIPLYTTNNATYQEVDQYSEGLCKVSTLKLRFMDLAYHSDYADIAGIWGYVNEDGIEVIPPQYIYADDFILGLAVVCKGKWTISKKWDNKYCKGRYWTEEELWGAIDTSGNEVIPCIFDEIEYFENSDSIFKVHYGGRENGHWGIMDNKGNWLVEPIFDDISYEYRDGLFAFYDDDKCEDSLMGIYDVNQKKVIFDPQFSDVNFCDDGYIEVEIFDNELGRKVERIIDLDGNERFHSIYSRIYSWKKPYEVVISDKDGDRHGLIDEDGSVILPCKYDLPWNGIISYEKRFIIFIQDGKQGIMDFDDNVIVEPIYYEIRGADNPLFTVRVGDEDDYKEGLITPDGKEVLPAIYTNIRWCSNNRIICELEDNFEVHQLEILTHS